MNNIIYPKEYEDPNKRIGKKFKYFKVEEYEPPEEKKETPPKRHIGKAKSGRSEYNIARSKLVENFMIEWETPTFADILMDYELREDEIQD